MPNRPSIKLGADAKDVLKQYRETLKKCKKEVNHRTIEGLFRFLEEHTHDPLHTAKGVEQLISLRNAKIRNETIDELEKYADLFYSLGWALRHLSELVENTDAQHNTIYDDEE